MKANLQRVVEGKVYYTYRGACRVLGIRMPELMRLLAQGALPWVQAKPNQYPLIPAEALAAYRHHLFGKEGGI